MERKAALGSIPGLMEGSIKDSGITESNMVLECMSLLMGMYSMEYGIKEKEFIG